MTNRFDDHYPLFEDEHDHDINSLDLNCQGHGKRTSLYVS
jgi:hypothetical protein